MAVPVHVVDAFTSEAFRGNPAGVVVTDTPLAPALLPKIAAEMRHSETAFAVPSPDGSFALRWLTPTTEVDLCGHATLATAHVLRETGRVAESATITFHTRSGVLTAAPGPRGTLELDFPALPVAAPTLAAELGPALGVPIVETWQARSDLLVVTASERHVRDARPDFRALLAQPMRAVILTARCDDRTVDFVSRFFAPSVGVDEDPVTGSAHCALAPFWAARLGRTALTGFQCSARGGQIDVETVGARVKLRGHARTILRGELLV